MLPVRVAPSGLVWAKAEQRPDARGTHRQFRVHVGAAVNDIIWDVETYPNVFTLHAQHAHLPIEWSFEISDWCNDSRAIVEWVNWLGSVGARLVGFNSIGFDYPILHTLCRMGYSDARTLYDKAQAIITAQDDDNRWMHQVKPTNRLVAQLDLFLVHHFDNRARSTSLKVLAFNMRTDNISDLPYPVGSTLTAEQLPVLRRYNREDVIVTKRFYHESADMIRFREELTARYQRDFMNHNDTKIGKDYFVMELENAGVQCYDYGPMGRQPRQTKRPSIALKSAILPWIEFQHPEFQRVLNWFKEQTITETKGVFSDITARVRGFDFMFGLGGIHGSVESEIIESNDEFVIVDLDVTSYYPTLAITNGFHPAHLGTSFVNIYQRLFEQRKQYPKGSPENAMLKLALNGVYGDSNNVFSVFYDPLFTMSITLNGQLLLCLLAEMVMLQVPGVKLIQCNTDGMTVRIPHGSSGALKVVCESWERQTKLTLEQVTYRRMCVRDVNNYIGQYWDGRVKRKGAYEHDLEWHQNHSALVVPKVAEKVLIEGASIRETVMNWPNILDFMLRVKVPRSSRLIITYPEVWGDTKFPLQNTTRYLVTRTGGRLFKMMPPLKGRVEWRQIGVDSGWNVTECNDIEASWNAEVDWDYYVNEVEKLVNGLS